MSEISTLSGKTYYIKTYGCQMNLHDAERVAGLLDAQGCMCVASVAEADIVVFMTCCVREHADEKFYGQASSVVSAPPPPSGKRVVCVGGCIAQREGKHIREHVRCTDIVFGTDAIASLPDLLEEAFLDQDCRLRVDIGSSRLEFSSDLPSRRAKKFSAWVPIMVGCNNFCTFCIVPHVRGREKSRTMESVLAECRSLVDDGVLEICLLGQNVNSYGKNIYGKACFDELLYKVAETGVKRLRFTSSNPKDLSDATISAMAELDCVMPHLHLAVQSGSNRILKAMNRRYTKERYLDLCERLYKGIPDLALTTDIIVGFPGETEEDFLETLSLVKQARFSSAYTFIYSPREGTPAAKLPDDTPREVIMDRFMRLTQQVASQAHAANERELHKKLKVLVEGASKKDPGSLTGHSEKNVTVHISAEVPDPASLVGTIVDVNIEETRTWYLRGSLCGEIL